MNFVKSVFFSSYVIMLAGVTAYSALMMSRGAEQMAWLGVMLTVAPMLAVLSLVIAFKNRARTSEHFPVINLLGVVGVALTVLACTRSIIGAEPLVLAAVSWVAFLFYAYWYSSYGGREPSVQLVVGENLPEFRVKNVKGEVISSSQFVGKPSILIFYRGNWCPFCMAQLKELAMRYEEISNLGVRVAMISPQPHTNTVQLAKKFRIGLSFEFLTDEGQAAARSLGILNLHGTPMGLQALGYDSDTVMPTVIITDKHGKIVWTHETDNHRIRPEPELYLGVLRHKRLVPASS